MLARFDFSLVQHALANLLINAATHTPPGTTIEVRAQFAEDCLVLTVADRGPGIPSELLPRIFDKFVRAPNAPAGGSGLGLTIARGTYYLVQNDISKNFHDNICKETKKVKATGSVKEVDGKKEFTATKIEVAE